MSKVALQRVVAKIRADEWPSALEVEAMLREAGCDEAEVRSLASDYGNALARESSDAFLASLRLFSLG
jgi:hypothetical protein